MGRIKHEGPSESSEMFAALLAGPDAKAFRTALLERGIDRSMQWRYSHAKRKPGDDLILVIEEISRAFGKKPIPASGWRRDPPGSNRKGKHSSNSARAAH